MHAHLSGQAHSHNTSLIRQAPSPPGFCRSPRSAPSLLHPVARDARRRTPTLLNHRRLQLQIPRSTPPLSPQPPLPLAQPLQLSAVAPLPPPLQAGSSDLHDAKGQSTLGCIDKLPGKDADIDPKAKEVPHRCPLLTVPLFNPACPVARACQRVATPACTAARHSTRSGMAACVIVTLALRTCL